MELGLSEAAKGFELKYVVLQVFWYFDQVTGEFRYRIGNPSDSLSTHPDFTVLNLHIFHPLLPQLIIEADLVILHLMPDEEVFQIIYQRKRLGKITLFEIADDFLHLGPWVGKDDAHRSPQIRQNWLWFASLCDGMQFSTPEVQKAFGYLNKTNSVVENQCNHYSKAYPEAPFVFGWGGSKGHEEDLAQIAPVIKRFLEKHPAAEFRYMGYPPIYERLFNDLPPGQSQLIPAGPVGEWYTFLEGLQVGLAPLGDTEFNRCRSDVKFIEYASHTVVPVLADAPPYRTHAIHGNNALIFKSIQELEAILEDLYENPQRRLELARNAYRYAWTKRNLPDHVGRRVAFYRSVLKHEPFVQKLPVLPDCASLIAYMRSATSAYGQGDYSHSLTILDKVLNMMPTYQIAHVWRAKTLTMMGAHQQVLDVYSSYNFHPIYLDLTLECLIISAQALGDPVWKRFLQILSNPVLKHQLDPELASKREERFKRILEANPYQFDSLTGLARLLARRREPEALALYDRAISISPEAADLRQQKEKARARIQT